MRVAWVAVLVAAMLAAIALLMRHSGAGPTPPMGADAPSRLQRIELDILERTPAPQPREDETWAEVLVLADEQPVPRAPIFEHRMDSGFSLPPTPVSHTDSDGVARLRGARVRRVAVQVAGFRSAQADVEHGHRTIVRLRRAQRLVVRCRDDRGRPVPDCDVFATKAGVGPFLGYAGLDDRTAVYGGVTNDEGSLTIELGSGTYAVRLTPPDGLAITSTNMDRSGNAEVPGAPVVFEVTRLYAAVVHFEDDAVAIWKGTGRGLPPPGGAFDGGWVVAQDALQRGHPGDLVIVRTPDWRSGAPPGFTVEVCTERRGWQLPMEVELQPLPDVDVRTVSMRSIPVREPQPTGRVTTVLVDAKGEALALPRTEAIVHFFCDSNSPQLVWTAQLGERVALPVGDYRVKLSCALLAPYIDGTVQKVTVGGDDIACTFRVREELHSVGLSISLEGAAVLGPSQAVLLWAKNEVRGFSIPTIVPTKATLPLAPGDWVMRFWRPGCKALDIAVTVAGSTEVSLPFKLDGQVR